VTPSRTLPHKTSDSEGMTSASPSGTAQQDQAVIVIATPARADLPDYRAIVFHTADDTADISPRLTHAAACTWAADRHAVIAVDEHNTQAALRDVLDRAAEP
jgi:hypothetical protein